MKIRILSDLHLDINNEFPFVLEDEDTFIVLCGDISGDYHQTQEWINNNLHRGVFVEGNHIGYDSDHSIQYIDNMREEHQERLIKNAEKIAAQQAEEDKKRKEAIDARNDAESFVFQTEDALKQVGDSVDAADKSAVEADIAAVKSFLDAHKEAEAMTEADVAELKAAQEKLTQSAQKVFAKMYEQAQAAQGAAGAGPDMNAGAGQAGPDMNAGASNGADDDVIDADFKEV